jgi:uncharacterized protein YkwD
MGGMVRRPHDCRGVLSVTVQRLGGRRVIASVLVALSLTVVAAGCGHSTAPPPAAPTADVGAAGRVLAKVNAFRSTNGRGSLQAAYDATGKAQALAQAMASQHQTFHSSSSSSGITRGWSALAENVGVAPSAGQALLLMEASPDHRANLLGAYNQVGIGVAYGSDGRAYLAVELVSR